MNQHRNIVKSPNAKAKGFLLLALALAIPASPAHADVKAGVDAWSRGDFETAIAEWEGPAEAGDADALFNLGQAYRLGRGVPVDFARAENFYARAAALGHVRAADTYGLLLFQLGRREQALPFIRAAAGRGDPRSQYLLGIAHFNGDLEPRDHIRAYALMLNANRQGLPQAAPALAEMDKHIPMAERQTAAGLARQLEAEAEASLAREMAALDLATQEPAAQSAVAEALQATGTEDPAQAGASYANPEPVEVAQAGPVQSDPAPAPVQPTSVATAPAQAQVQSATPAARATGGPWRVQLGAFSVRSNADNLWARLSGRPELSGAEKLMIPTGRVTRLLAGGYATRAAADSACRALKASGNDCLVTRN